MAHLVATALAIALGDLVYLQLKDPEKRRRFLKGLKYVGLGLLALWLLFAVLDIIEML